MQAAAGEPHAMTLHVEIEQEIDGRWIAGVINFMG